MKKRNVLLPALCSDVACWHRGNHNWKSYVTCACYSQNIRVYSIIHYQRIPIHRQSCCVKWISLPSKESRAASVQHLLVFSACYALPVAVDLVSNAFCCHKQRRRKTNQKLDGNMSLVFKPISNHLRPLLDLPASLVPPRRVAAQSAQEPQKYS